MTSPKRKIWMQFSQGTKSNTEPFLKFAAQSNQNKTYSIKKIQMVMVFFLGKREGGFDFVVWHLRTPSNSFKLNQKKEFDGV